MKIICPKAVLLAAALAIAPFLPGISALLHAANPIITDFFTADLAPLVVGDTTPMER